MSITQQMFLELKDSVDNGDKSAKKFWDEKVSENEKKNEGLIKDIDDLQVIRYTLMQRNIYAQCVKYLNTNPMIKIIKEKDEHFFKKCDDISFNFEKEINNNKKGCILFSHQRDNGLVFWCPYEVLNIKNLPNGKAWPENVKLIDSFNF